MFYRSQRGGAERVVGRPRPRCVARERAPQYDAGPPGLFAALATIARRLEELAAVPLDECGDDEVAEAALAAAAAVTRLSAEESRLLAHVDARGAYAADACVTTASWLRHRAKLGWGDARRRVARARTTARMPALGAAFAAGEVTAAHVDAVAGRAIPARAAVIAEHDETLADLARRADPRDVGYAVGRIVELADRDGAKAAPVRREEDLRSFAVRDGYGSLKNLDATVTPLLGELLRRVRDVYGSADPADVPPEQRRTPTQRFHDAVRDALTVALERHPGSVVDGVKTHVVLLVDLWTLLGDDARARIRPRLSAGGAIDPEVARHLIATSNPTVRAVLSMGPWLPINVGRAQRTLPDVLRGASQLLHGHCRGPGCDRPFAWTEADHVRDFAAGGTTGLDNDAPLCTGHHRLKHRDGWVVTLDPDDGTVTWTSRDGTRRLIVPPPDP